MNPYRLFLKIALLNLNSIKRQQNIIIKAFEEFKPFREIKTPTSERNDTDTNNTYSTPTNTYADLSLSYQETAATVMSYSEKTEDVDNVEFLNGGDVCISSTNTENSPVDSVNEVRANTDNYTLTLEGTKKDSEVQLPFQLPVQKPFHSYVAFHLKTTGPSPKRGHTIIEVAAVKVLHGIIIGTFDRLIDPKRKLSNNFTKNTGIANEDVKGKPVLSEVLSSFCKFVDKFPLVAHNSNHGIKFLTYYNDVIKDIPSDDTLNWVHQLSKESTKTNINQSINIGDFAKQIKRPLPTNCRTFDEALAISHVYEGARSK